MSFLPIVERELRVAARRRGTYWNRTISALAAIVVCSWMFLVASGDPVRELGPMLFGVVSGLFFLTSLLAGVRYTADSLSEEKREGTLGLLFLTDLRGYDVVLGKLVATSVNAFYGLLAIFPVLAIPLLMGGVSPGEFWRMALVLANTLFFSLAAGLMLSSVSRAARKAMAGTFLLVLLVNGGVPAFGAWWAYIRNANAVEPHFLVPSAGYGYALAYDALHRTKRSEFTASVAVTHAAGWCFLLLASMAARRTWQDRPAGVRGMRLRERWRRWTYGGAEEGARFRRRWLEVNPCSWLGGRQRLKPLTVWGFLGAVGLLWLWGYVKFEGWADTGAFIMTALLLHGGLRVWIASEACQKLGPDHRSGALELLLSTPLSVQEIVHGHLLALQRQFFWPVVVTLAVDLIFLFTGLRQGGDSGDRFWIWLWLGGMAVFAFDAYVLAWTGLWAGMVARHANRAAGTAVMQVMVLPWLAIAALLVVLSRTPAWRRIDDSPGFLLGLWFGLSMVNSVAFLVWSRHRLHSDLRATATQRYSGVAGEGKWWWPFGGQPPAAA